MVTHDLAPAGPAAPQQIYISSGKEDLITLAIEAWKRGYALAVAKGSAALRDLTAVAAASEDACDEALLIYVPMDRERFRDIFTIAWASGYWTRVQESPATFS